MPKKKTVLSFLLIVAMVFSIALTALADGHISTGEITITPNTDPYEYGTTPDGLYVFLYHGYNPYFTGEFDTSECELDRLYVHNQTTNEIVEISTQAVTAYTTTKDALYYITESQTIYKTDYTGRNHTALYQCTEGEIDAFSSYLELLTFIENGNKVVFLDSNTGNAQVVFAYDDLDWIFMLSNTELLLATLAEEHFVLDLGSRSIRIVEDAMTATAMVNAAVMDNPEETELPLSLRLSTVENDISFPLTDYPAAQYSSSMVNNFTHYRPISWFHKNSRLEGCSDTNCDNYCGARQCEGFAWFAHDSFLHIADRSLGDGVWKYIRHVEHMDIKFDESEAIVRQFFSTLNTGDYVRYGQGTANYGGDGKHSIVFVAMDTYGIWAYECNQSYYKRLTDEEIDGHPESYFGCGVHLQYYTIAKIASHYDSAVHYVVHDYSGEKTCTSITSHKVACDGADITFTSKQAESEHKTALDNGETTTPAESLSKTHVSCTGYLMQAHTGSKSYEQHSDIMHRVYFACCNGYVLQRHTIVSGTRDYCSVCGWVEGTTIMSVSIPS